ncbi:hypothetical protein D3C73_740920 [compost metagenome]
MLLGSDLPTDITQLVDAVADITQCPDQAFVVLRHRQVVVGVAGIEVGAQAATVENRHGNGRRDIEEAARRTEHCIAQQRFGTRRRAEVQVRIELCFTGVDILARCLDPPTRGDQVRTTTEQLGRQHRRQRHGARLENVRPDDFIAAIRAFAEQHGQRDLGALQAFFGVDQVGFGRGFQAFGLLELILAVDPGAQATLAQVEHLFGAFEVFGGQVMNDVSLPKIAVGTGHVGGQGQLRSLLIDFRSAGLAQCSFPGVTLTAPEIKVVIESGTDAAHGGVVVALPQRVLILGQTRTADTGAGIEGRHPRGIGGVRGGAGLMGTGVGDLHVGAVVQGFADQAVELRIAKAFPPVAFRPCRRRQRHAAEGLPGLEVFRIEADAFGGQAAVTGATRQAHGQQHQAQTGAQGFTVHCCHPDAAR